MKEAIEQGNIELIAKYLNLYWAQKKKMAKGAEPSYVSQVLVLKIECFMEGDITDNA